MSTPPSTPSTFRRGCTTLKSLIWQEAPDPEPSTSKHEQTCSFPLLDLPSELIVYLGEAAGPEVTARLALTCKALLSLLRHSFRALEEPHNRKQKLLFLSVFDKYNPQWMTCWKCLRFHHRERGGYPSCKKNSPDAFHVQLRGGDRIANLAQDHWRLVQRAKHFQDCSYGLPYFSSKRKTFHDESLVATCWSAEGRLLLRLTSLFDIFDTIGWYSMVLTINVDGSIRLRGPPGLWDGVALCGCPGNHLRESVRGHCESLMDEFGRLRVERNDDLTTRDWDSETNPRIVGSDLECARCRMTVEVGVACQFEPGLGCRPCIKLVRYFDLGSYADDVRFSVMDDATFAGRSLKINTKDEWRNCQ
jgi:hypothetical protein